jgi:integrase
MGQWQKLSDDPRDRGIYKEASTGTLRVFYQSAEISNGKRFVKQRTKSFPRGSYSIIVDAEIGVTKRVTEVAAARRFKRDKDDARKAGRVRDVDQEAMTVGDFWPRYLERGERRPSTRDTIERSYRNHIAPTFGDTPLRSISAADVDAWHNSLKAGASAKKKAARTLHAMFQVAVKLGLADKNPAVVLDLPADRARVINVDEIITDQQLGKLKAAIDDRYALMIDLLAEGMRIGEVVGLLRMDVNLRGDVNIRHNLVEVSSRMVAGPLKTENSYRTLPLAHLRDAIQRHLSLYSQSGLNGFVFTGPDGTAPIQTSNWRDRAYFPALKAAGLPRTVPHALRHRIAWDLIDSGKSVDQVAAWIGDTPQTVRTVYANHPKIRSMAEIAALRGERYREANGQ